MNQLTISVEAGPVSLSKTFEVSAPLGQLTRGQMVELGGVCGRATFKGHVEGAAVELWESCGWDRRGSYTTVSFAIQEVKSD